MNILDVALAGRIAASGGGGGSGTDNYNDLSNLPQINGETLAGNKSSSNLGLQDEIDSDHKLSSDLVDDANHTNKFVTSTEKQTWSAKQNSIDADHKLSSDLVDDANKTNKFVTSTEKQTWNNKQNAIDLDHKLSSPLVSFTTAEAAALASGIDSAKVGQISTNQTNILYVSEHNANRNLLLNTASTTTIDGVTFTVNADKSVTITGSQNNPNQHTKFVLGKFTANRPDLVLDSGIAASASANIFINTQDGVTTTRNLGHATITGTDLNTERDYQILVIAGTSNINTTIKPMICTQADWNATQEYEASGGLPNYDLTRLEAEDRASLAEVVDSGAKNLWDFANATFTAATGATFTKTDTALTVNSNNVGWARAYTTITLKAGSYVLSATISNFSVAGSAKTSMSISSTQTGIDPYGYKEFTSTGNGTYNIPFTVPSNGTYYIVYYVNDTSTSSAASYTASNNMICTKAAFGVSSKFVPYRPNYDLVAMLVPKTMYKTVNFSAANTWTYSNLSFTVPAGTVYLLIASISWNSGKPTGICISTTNTSNIGSADILAINEAANNGITCIYQMPSDQNVDKAVYVHVKNESATGSSPVRFTVIRIV